MVEVRLEEAGGGGRGRAGPLLQMRGSSHRLRGRAGSQLQMRGSLVTGCLSSKGLHCFSALLLFYYVEKLLKTNEIPGICRLVCLEKTGAWKQSVSPDQFEKGSILSRSKASADVQRFHQQMTKNNEVESG